MSSDTLIRLEDFKTIFVGVQNSTFFQGVGTGFLVKNDHIFKSAFSLVYVPRSACRKETLPDTLIRYLSCVQNSTFLQEVGPGLLVKNKNILKSAFFTCLCPQGSRCVEKLL